MLLKFFVTEEQRKTGRQKGRACCLWINGGKALEKWNFSTHLNKAMNTTKAYTGMCYWRTLMVSRLCTV